MDEIIINDIYDFVNGWNGLHCKMIWMKWIALLFDYDVYIEWEKTLFFKANIFQTFLKNQIILYFKEIHLFAYFLEFV